MADENQQAEAAAPTAAAGENAEAKFGIQRLYLKDVSFESPDSPEAFRKPYNPQVNFSINSRSNQIEDSLYEVVLRLTAEVKQEDKTVFLVEVQQAGIFDIQGLQGDQLEQALAIACPSILFPYGREALDSLVVKGSFPPLMLAPINFESIYLQAKKQQANQQTDSGGQPPQAQPGSAESEETH